MNKLEGITIEYKSEHLEEHKVSKSEWEGRIVRAGDGTPVYGCVLKLIGQKNFFGGEVVLAEGETGKGGSFSLSCDLEKTKNIKKVWIEIWSPKTGAFEHCHPIHFDTIHIENEEGGIFEEPFKAKVYEYSRTGGTRYLPENRNHIQQPLKSTFKEDVLGVVATQEFKHLGVDIGVLVDTTTKKITEQLGVEHINLLTTDQVQKAFGIPKENNLTPEKRLIETIFKFLEPRAFLKGSHEDELILNLDSSKYSKEENGPDCPNVTIVLEKVRDEKDKDKVTNMKITRIDLDFSTSEKKVDLLSFKPGDKDFDFATLIARNVAGFWGEINHLAGLHVVAAELAMAFTRCFVKSKLGPMIQAPCEYIANILNNAETIIYDKKTGVLGVGPYDGPSIKRLINTTVAGSNYSSVPSGPYYEGDTYGKDKEELYKGLSKAVDEKFFNAFGIKEDNEIPEEFQKSKEFTILEYETTLCNKDLINNSPEYEPWFGINDMSKWDRTSEVDIRPKGKGEDGNIHSFEPIIGESGKLDKEAIGKLKAIIRYFYELIIKHDYIHNRQQDEVLDLRKMTFSPYELYKEGKLHKKDEYMGTPPDRALKVLTIAYFLNGFQQHLDKKTLSTHPYILKEIKDNVGVKFGGKNSSIIY